MLIKNSDKITTLSVMYEIISSMGKTMDWREEIRHFLEKVSFFFGYEVASFLRFSTKKKKFYLEEVIGFPEGKELIEHEIDSGYGVEEVMERAPFIIQSISPKNTPFIMHPILRPMVRSLGFFPVKREDDKLYGVVRLFSFREDGFPDPYPAMITSLCNSFSLILSHIDAKNEILETKEKLFHSQKIEAIGRLAGGIAHNFNNLLAIVMGYASLLKDKEEEPANIMALNNIIYAAERGKTLTYNLLDFARAGKMVKEPLLLTELLDSALNIIKETVGKGIVVDMGISASVKVKGDRTKLSDAFMSIIFNSIEAMPEGGRMQVCLVPPKKKENMAVISFRDTGHGMNKETLERVFEPFFTTKEMGAGLGLTTAYGIIKEHGGYIKITSKPGKGTEVKVYLPVIK
ncbi:MAG: hypothetical protein HZC45_07315 [Deltaproteobacteria bacterium]|nr:hypothetical protein [Deltaproteobacteria bacterium]